MARGKTDAEGGPFLKWAGGKGALLEDYERLYPKDIDVYHEPFLGAGAVFFRLAETGRAGKAHLSDVNPDLVIAFRAVKSETDALIARLRKLRLNHSEEHYYAERERFNRPGLGDVERAALVIYLNKTGFNGLYRVNSKGHFNVPSGRHVTPTIYSEKTLRAVATQLRHATIEERDFATVTRRAKAGDFVYFDPPYVPLNRTAYFTSYAKGGFGKAEQARLAATFRELDRAGVKVMLSNHDTPLMRELYRGFALERLTVTRNINSKASRRKDPVDELVVRNYRD